jgi:hypothetical protein
VRVLVINNLYPPNAIGGYERLVAAVADDLADRGHHVSVLTSDYGTEEPQRGRIPVDRRLRLLVSEKNIYQPFGGSWVEREAINARNLSLLESAIRSSAPDVLLVGNLYFLDRSILSGLQAHADKTAYLLTDVWRIHFDNDSFLQQYFRHTVFQVGPGTPQLVPPDPSPVWPLSGRTLAEQADRLAAQALEQMRRRRREEELIGRRRVAQLAGDCVLCGPTLFTVRRAGPATLMLGATARAEASCARCGLDGPVRGAFHVASQLLAPQTVVGWVGGDDRLRRRLQATAARLEWFADLNQAVAAGSVGAGLALCLERLPEGGIGDALLSRLAAAGTSLVLAEQPPGEDDLWELLARAEACGFHRAVQSSFWSERYGYLGRDHHAWVLQARGPDARV